MEDVQGSGEEMRGNLAARVLRMREHISDLQASLEKTTEEADKQVLNSRIAATNRTIDDTLGKINQIDKFDNDLKDAVDRETFAAKQGSTLAEQAAPQPAAPITAQAPSILSDLGLGDDEISSPENTTTNASTQSTQEQQQEITPSNSQPSNSNAGQREQEQTQVQAPESGPNDSHRAEAGRDNQEGQGQEVSLADRAAQARQGITEATPSLQERLSTARQDATKRQQREAESQQRRQFLYTPAETEGAPATQVLVTQNENGEAVAAAPEAVAAPATTTTQENPTAPELKTIDGVYQFGSKQNVRIAEISTSNDFRGPRRVSKEAVKHLRKNRDQQEVLLYRHPNGKIYVLDGKAAIEAQRANRRATVPARFFNGTTEQAAEVAHMRKPLPPQTLLNQRADRVLSTEPRTFEEYALQTVLGIMRKVGNKPAFSLADFIRYSGFGGVQTNHLRMNFGQTIGENDIKDLRSRGVISNNTGRRLIRFDTFAKEWMDRDGNEGEDEGNLIDQLTDILQNHQSPEKIINRLEDAQGIQNAPLTESLLPFHVTPEEALFIAENDLYDTMQAILNNTDEIPEVSEGEQQAYEEMVRSHTAGDGVMDINGIFNTLNTSDDENLRSLKTKIATYATRQAAETQNESDGHTGGKIVFESANGRSIESDDNGDFFSRWTPDSALTEGQAIGAQAARRVATVLQKAFTNLKVSFSRTAFQNALKKAVGTQNSRQSEQAVYLQEQLQAASNELKTAQAAFNSKRQQLDRDVQRDQVDLFGQRASTTPTNLFDERVDNSAREKAIQPFKDRVTKAQARVTELNTKLTAALKQSVQQQSMFSKEQSKPELKLPFVNNQALQGKTANLQVEVAETGEQRRAEMDLLEAQNQLKQEHEVLKKLLNCI
jgi:hypothetical protein